MMWRSYRGFGFLLLLSLVLFGCGTAGVQTGDHPEQSEPIHSQSQTPPTLELKIGDDTIRTFRGTYSWSYYDAEEKMMAGINADAESPHEMIDMDLAQKVDGNETVTLKFGEPPENYEIYVLDAESGHRSGYQIKFDLSKYEGPTLFEIFVRWEQGEASYIVALDIE